MGVKEKFSQFIKGVVTFFTLFDLRFWLFAALFVVYFLQEIVTMPDGIKAIVIVGGLLYIGLTIFTKMGGKLKFP